MNQYIRRTLAATLLGTACAAALAAEDQTGQLETVVVGSRKIVENIQDVPIAIQAFDSRKLEQEHLADIAGIARMTPTLNFQIGLLPSDTRPAIRGVLAERGRPNVAILVDGVDATTDSAFVAGGGVLANLRFVDVDRVEIVEGPQNVLYGRSAMSGAINYITKRPGQQFEAEVSADGARFGTYELKASMSAPLNESTAVRLTAGHWSTDGWAHNPRTGGLLGDGSVTGTSLALSFKPSEKFSAFVRGQFSKEHYGPAPRTFASSVLPNGNLNTAVGGVLLPVPGRPANYPGQFSIAGNLNDIGYNTPSKIDFGADPLTGKDYRGTDVDAKRAVLELNWDTPIGQLISLTGYTTADMVNNEDFDQTSYANAAGPNNFLPLSFLSPTLPNGNFPFGLQADSEYSTHAKQFSQELRLQHQGDKLRWLVDGLYWHEDQDAAEGGQFWTRAGTNPQVWGALLAFAILGPTSPPLNLLTTPKVSGPAILVSRKSDSYSLGVSMNYALTDAIEIGAGGRYIRESYDYRGTPCDSLTISTFQLPCADFTTNPPATITTNHLSQSKFTPNVIARWKLSDRNMVYASFAQGFKPGGVDLLTGSGKVNRSFFKPEKLNSFEIGTKNDLLDRRLRLNAAIYYNDDRDQQVAVNRRDPVTGFVQSGTQNAGRTETYGLETSLEWLPTDRVTLALSYAFTKARFVDYVQVGPNVPLSSINPLNTAEAGNDTASLSGHKTPNTPENKLATDATWRFPMSNGRNFILHGAAQYTGKVYVDDINLTWLPAWVNVDASAGIEADRWSATFYVTNLLDDDTIRTAIKNVDYGTNDVRFYDNFRWLQPVRAASMYLTQPRTYGLRASYRF